MAERELAHRMFAREFNDSRFHISSAPGEPAQSDIYAPNFLVTTTGAKVNRVFIAGVITEVEDIGSQKGEDKELWKARVSDPTGTFTVYSGNYQPEASLFLSCVEIPSFVTVTGKVRSYEPGDGSIFVSLRPEEINYADESIRDRWLVDTAELTLERLDIMEDALATGMRGKGLLERLEAGGMLPSVADGVSMALDHYSTSSEQIEDMRMHILELLRSMTDGSKVKEEIPDAKQTIMELLLSSKNGKGLEYPILLKEVTTQGIPQETVELAVRALFAEGSIYEPKAGLFKAVV